jgi:putative ABC transport system permease protein
MRHILKSKSHSYINLFGLTLGLSVSILILLYVQHELSFDKYLPGYERVIRIQPIVSTGDGDQEWATSEGFLIPSITSMYPEVESAARILRNDTEMIFKKDSTLFSQDGIVAADSTFFKVFPFEFIYGDRNTALDKSESVVISREVSKKFFGNTNPVGKLLSTDFATFEVTGVIEEVPPNSHFHFQVIFPLKLWFRDADQSRNMYAFYSYVRLKSPDQTKPFIQKTLKDWYKIYGYSDQINGPAPSDVKITLGAKPLADIHLKSHAEKEYEANGQLQLIYIFIAVAVLILAIATINYVNLSNAMAIRRSKEVAIRKTIGASREKLFLSFILESYGLTFFAFILSLIVVTVLIPQFNIITGKQFDFSVLLDARFFATVFFTWLCLGFIAGFYPAMILSSFSPIQALKSNVRSSRHSVVSLNLRRGLIVFQFAISSFMIISAFTIQQQLEFIETRNIGFDKNNVLVVPLVGDAREKSASMRDEIARLPAVESCALSSVVPGKRVVFLTVRIPDLAASQLNAQGTDDGTRDMRVMSVDHDFVKTLGLQISEGRDFSIENAADAQGAFLINEAAVKAFGLKDPIGKPFEYLFAQEPKRGKIIGVVKDFNFASVHTPVEPLMMHIYPSFHSYLCIRLSTNDLRSSVEQIETFWKTISSVPFSYQFLDATYNSMYLAEKATSQVITYLTALALIIACLGLFGIVSFFAIQRTREVGIRKVFGATQFSLLRVLSDEYIIMVAIGNILAFYPSWVLVNKWLQQFAYRIDFSLSIFLMSLVASGLLAIVSIFYVIHKTAKTNPANILRIE